MSFDELGRPLRETTFCVVDLETTGGSAQAGSMITEIGAVKVRAGEVLGEFQTLVNPHTPIPPFIAVLTGITAAVVGVIANLGVYFAVHTLFAVTVAVDRWGLSLELPDVSTVRWVVLAIAVVAAVLLFRVRWSVLRTLGVCAVLGLAAGLAGLPL